jgi:soluble lytic murein transglycosylase-like protein
MLPLVLAVGALIGGAVLLSGSSKLSLEQFRRGLPPAGRIYAQAILDAAARQGVDPWLIAGILARETTFGTSPALDRPGPNGRGDNGHGYGLMQIDDRTHGAWLQANAWWIPAVNIDRGAWILKQEIDRFKGDTTKAVAAYNAGAKNVGKAIAQGAHPDTVTTGKNYATDVLTRSAKFEASSRSVA